MGAQQQEAVMNLADQAAERMRRGVAPALSVFLTAREHGTSTRAVARALAARRRHSHTRRSVAPVDAWWNQ
jgi:TPP-dependent pyruvate/acetoin dehydrogenase alpha subunit